MTPMEIDAIERKFEDALCDLTMATDHQGMAINFNLSSIIDGISGRMRHLRELNDGTKNSYRITPGNRNNDD